MDGNAKNDLERTTEKAVNVSARSSRIFARIFSRFLIRFNRYYQKRFSSSLRALKNDGNTKELSSTPALTKQEAKELIAKARENGILIGVKKMQPDGEVGRNKSLHQQEKMAKNEIKYNKWDERRKLFKNIPVINSICNYNTNKYKQLSREDNEKSKEDRYVVICNKSHLAFLTEQLELLSKKRVEKMTSNELDDINKDGKVDNYDYQPLETRDINITPDKLDRINEDYGSCMVRDYNKNYCLQRLTKLEYCEIREKLFELKSHGAYVVNDNEVLVAINSDDLEEYMQYAPTDKPIKEFGEAGAKDIEAESNMSNLINLDIANAKEFQSFKNKYKGKDYIAIHNPDGTTTAIVKEDDTKQMVEDGKKKSSTAELLKEAEELVEQKNNEVEITSPEIEEDIELDH